MVRSCSTRAPRGRESRLVTNGGRILAVTGLGPTVGRAREVAYEAVGRVRFDGMRFRSDIAGPRRRARPSPSTSRPEA